MCSPPRRLFLRMGLAAGLTGFAGCNTLGDGSEDPRQTTTSPVDRTTDPVENADGNRDNEFGKPKQPSSFPALQRGGTVNVGGEQESYDDEWVVINPSQVTDTTRIEGVTEVMFRGENFHSFLLGFTSPIQTHYRMRKDGKPNAYILPVMTTENRVKYNIYIDEDLAQEVSPLHIIANNDADIQYLGQFLLGESFHGVYKNTVLGPSGGPTGQIWIGDYEEIPSEPLGLRADGVHRFWIE